MAVNTGYVDLNVQTQASSTPNIKGDLLFGPLIQEKQYSALFEVTQSGAVVIEAYNMPTSTPGTDLSIGVQRVKIGTYGIPTSTNSCPPCGNSFLSPNATVEFAMPMTLGFPKQWKLYYIDDDNNNLLLYIAFPGIYRLELSEQLFLLGDPAMHVYKVDLNPKPTNLPPRYFAGNYPGNE